jgi:hypothetical protein
MLKKRTCFCIIRKNSVLLQRKKQYMATLNDKLAAAWQEADKLTADKTRQGKFIVMQHQNPPKGIVLKGAAVNRTYGRVDAEGLPVLTIVPDKVSLVAGHERLGWVKAKRPAAKPASVAAADEDKPKRAAKPKSDES